MHAYLVDLEFAEPDLPTVGSPLISLLSGLHHPRSTQTRIRAGSSEANKGTSCVSVFPVGSYIQLRQEKLPARIHRFLCQSSHLDFIILQ